MEQLVGYAGSMAGGGPGLFEIADRFTVLVEHQLSNADIAVRIRVSGGVSRSDE
jgi:hypothetical protein